MTKGERVFVSTDHGDYIGIAESFTPLTLTLVKPVRVVVTNVEEFLFTGACDPRWRYRFPNDLSLNRRRIRFTTAYNHKIPGEDDLAYPDEERLLRDLGGD